MTPAAGSSLVPMDQMQAMAKSLVASKMFGFKTEAEAMSIMLIAQAEGRSPALAIRDYHVVQGRPTLKAEAMLARFQAEGGVVEWTCYTDQKVSAKFSHPKSCPVPVEIVWTMDMAKRIGLANRDNWRNYGRAMLRSRVSSEGVRTAYPGITVGFVTVDEAMDEVKEKDITPASGAMEALTEEQRVKCTELADKVRDWFRSGSLTDAYLEIENANLEEYEYIYLWTHFDSTMRRQLKEEGERQQIKLRALEDKTVISDAQKKRLEARIGELKIDREKVKKYCADTFSKKHFADLTRAEYDNLDKQLDAWYGAETDRAAGGHLPLEGSVIPAVPPAASAPAPDEALLIKGLELAELGTEKYAAWWGKLKPTQRVAIGAERHEKWKAIAAKVPT